MVSCSPRILSLQPDNIDYCRAMDDIDGPFMAERIYKRMFRNGGLELSVIPYALDDAARELRDLGAPASRWATYVHFGL
jgi:hypothetical protein